MKQYLLYLILFVGSLSSVTAQVENYALKFTSEGTINCDTLFSSNDVDAYTLQCWISPASWTSGAYIWSRGTDNEQFALKLGSATGTLLYMSGNKELPIVSSDLKINNWAQITIMQSSDGINVWVNNVKVVNNAASMNIPASGANLEMGGNYGGRIDEVRFWNTNIDMDYLLWQNTVNFLHPNYKNLVTYYKGDQKECKTRLFDYMGHHHGLFTQGVSREKVTDNNYLEYKILTAYTNFTRFFDRGRIKENYLMANDIIILGIGTNAEGEATLVTPNNHAKLINTEYLKEYQGRSGVLSLKGSGSKLDAGLNALRPVDAWYQSKKSYSFLTWIYLENWTEGAFILHKERSATEGFSIRLGKKENNEVIVRLNGNDYVWKNNGKDKVLSTGEWIHFGFSTTVNAPRPGAGKQKNLFRIVLNGVGRYADDGPTEILDSDLSMYADISATIAKDLDAKLDETVLWHKETSDEGIAEVMKAGMRMPSIGGAPLDESYAAVIATYYKYDDENNIGYDSYSTDEFIKIMRGAYEGRSGYTMRLGISGHDGWQNTLGNATKRERMANEIKAIVDATGVDGVETDMEWAYSNPGVTNYSNLIALLKQKMPDKIITCSPHAVAYNLNQNARDAADRFSFQVYTNRNWFTMDGFRNAYNSFVNFGYPKNKIILSYGTTTSTGSINGIENGYRSVIGADPRPDVESITMPDGNNYLVCSVNQVKERAQFTVDNHLPGLMYWDMGNDLDVTDPLSLCRAVNFVTASNVDYLHTDETITGIKEVNGHKGIQELSIYPNPASYYFTCALSNGEAITKISVYSVDGKLISQSLYHSGMSTITQSCQKFGKGVFEVCVQSGEGNKYSERLIVK